MASVSKRKWTYKGVEKEAWILRYVDIKGVQRQETFKLKKQADAARRKVEEELLSGKHISRTDAQTVAFICEDYVRVQESRLGEGVISLGRFKNLKLAVDGSILPALGKRVAQQLTPLDVERWYRDLVKVRGLKPVTARARLQELGAILDFGIRRRYCTANPVPDARKELGNLPRAKVRTFDRDQVLRILAAVETRAPGQHGRSWRMMRVVVNLAALCGLRWGEIFALTVPHVQVDARVVEVRHSLTPEDELKGPKTAAGMRDVPLPPHFAEMLRQWMAADMQPDPRGLLFRLARPGYEGGAISSNVFHAGHWQPLLRRVGLEDVKQRFHFHALRHFAASNMIANGIPIPDTAQLLGHERFDTTLQIYAHPIMNGQRRSAAFDLMAADLRPTASQ